ncbi:hypothetical protein [Acidisoma sp. L85]|uniref:hypothetical protein n=1 Tax=Acidisoma sp. L85 TaxID=1641850 RepID=UPI0020B128A9|nr:hypothetical protein [Acidisoma sp. L85]
MLELLRIDKGSTNIDLFENKIRGRELVLCLREADDCQVSLWPKKSFTAASTIAGEPTQSKAKPGASDATENTSERPLSSGGKVRLAPAIMSACAAVACRHWKRPIVERKIDWISRRAR